MKTRYLWLAVVCFSFLAFRPLAWVPISLDNRVSVLLPSQPQETAMPEPVKMLAVKDETGIYIIITSPLGVDFQGNARKQYYDSVVEGTLESGKGRLINRSAFKVEDYDGVDFAASMARPNNEPAMLVFVRSLIVDKKSYVLQFIPATSTKDWEAQRQQFFDSITLH